MGDVFVNHWNSEDGSVQSPFKTIQKALDAVAANVESSAEHDVPVIQINGRYEPHPQTAWQSIDTAPKDGTWILVFEPDQIKPNVHVVHWGVSEWSSGNDKAWVTIALGPNPDTYDANDATHWMPLPAPPRS